MTAEKNVRPTKDTPTGVDCVLDEQKKRGDIEGCPEPTAPSLSQDAGLVGGNFYLPRSRGGL